MKIPPPWVEGIAVAGTGSVDIGSVGTGSKEIEPELTQPTFVHRS